MVLALRGTSDSSGKKYIFFNVIRTDNPKKGKIHPGEMMFICVDDKYNAKTIKLPPFDLPKNMRPFSSFSTCTLFIEKRTQIKWENGPKNVIEIVMNGLRAASGIIDSPRSLFESEKHKVKNNVLEISVRFALGAIKKRKEFRDKCQRKVMDILDQNKVKFSRVSVDAYPAGLKIKIYPPVGSEELNSSTS